MPSYIKDNRYLENGDSDHESGQGTAGHMGSTSGDRGRGRAAGLATSLATSLAASLATDLASGLATGSAGVLAARAGSSADLDNRERGRVTAGGGKGRAGDDVVGRGRCLALGARHGRGHIVGNGNG